MDCWALWKVLYNLSGSGQSAVSVLFCEGQPSPPISTTWEAYSSVASHGILHFSHLPSGPVHLTLEELETLWLGMNLMDP